MSNPPPPTDNDPFDERQRQDRRKGDRRSGDRRQGPRRVMDRIRDLGAYQPLSLGEKVFMFSLVLLVGVILGSLVYLGVWFAQGGNLETQYPETADQNSGEHSNLVNPFVPADNTVYELQLCPPLMMDDSIKMRFFKSMEDFKTCESQFQTRRRLDGKCKNATTAMISDMARVKTVNCKILGFHRSHWCEVTVTDGPDSGAKGFVPWECFKAPAK